MKSKSSKFYTIAEEIFNSVSHGVGAIAAAGGIGVLLVFAALYGDVYTIVSCAIYGASLIILYTSSTLYHSFQNDSLKHLFRIFDHCTIFFLIAGTYTPFTLITLRQYDEKLGWTLFAIVWAAAIIGVILNSIDLKKFEKVSFICYIAMGWVIVFAFKPLSQMLAPQGLWLLIAGGVAYTAGTIFYALRFKFMHGVWHLFTLAGSVLHFLAVLFYIVLA